MFTSNKKKIFSVLLLCYVFNGSWLFYQTYQRNVQRLDGFYEYLEHLPETEEEVVIKKITSSTVIFHVGYEVKNKSDYTNVFTDVLKKSDDVDNIQEIIDEYSQKTSEEKREYTNVIPNGGVVFYSGSPARFSEECSIYDNKIMFKDSGLLISEFKALIRKNSSSQ